MRANHAGEHLGWVPAEQTRHGPPSERSGKFVLVLHDLQPAQFQLRH